MVLFTGCSSMTIFLEEITGGNSSFTSKLNTSISYSSDKITNVTHIYIGNTTVLTKFFYVGDKIDSTWTNTTLNGTSIISTTNYTYSGGNLIFVEYD